MNWKWVLILSLMGILVIFTTQNYEIVKIQFLVWSFKTSRAIIIFIALAIGFIAGAILGYGSKKKRHS